MKMLAVPFPMRDGVLVEVVIPSDMTKMEAERLCKFILTLPLDFKP